MGDIGEVVRAAPGPALRDDPGSFTTGQIAATLRVSRSAIRDRIASGALASTPGDRRGYCRVGRADVVAFLASEETVVAALERGDIAPPGDPEAARALVREVAAASDRDRYPLFAGPR